MSSLHVVIPTAGSATRMGDLARSYPKCLLPLAGAPALVRQLRWLLHYRPDTITLVTNPVHTERVARLCARLGLGKLAAIRLVEQPTPTGPADAILRACRDLPATPCLVLLADTLLTETPPLDDAWIAFAPVVDFQRWCIAEFDDAGQLIALHDKPRVEPASRTALIGAYFLADGAIWTQSLQRCAADVASSHTSAEIAPALRRYAALRSLRGVEARSWIDCGTWTDWAQANLRLADSASGSVEFRDVTVDHMRSLEEALWFDDNSLQDATATAHAFSRWMQTAPPRRHCPPGVIDRDDAAIVEERLRTAPLARLININSVSISENLYRASALLTLPAALRRPFEASSRSPLNWSPRTIFVNGRNEFSTPYYFDASRIAPSTVRTLVYLALSGRLTIVHWGMVTVDVRDDVVAVECAQLYDYTSASLSPPDDESCLIAAGLLLSISPEDDRSLLAAATLALQLIGSDAWF